MSGGYDWDSGAERTDNVEDSRPVRISSPAIPRLTSTLLVPTTIPNARSLDGDVVRATDIARPTRPARGTRPMFRSSVSSRSAVLSTMRDASDPLPLETSVELHDPNNEAPAARRSPLAIASGTTTRGSEATSNPAASNPRGISGSRRGLPSSLSQRAHVFASIRDRSRTPVLGSDVSENRTPEE